MKYFAHETAVIDAGCQIGEGVKIWHYWRQLQYWTKCGCISAGYFREEC